MMHARKHAWKDSAPANTRGADADAGSPARLFRSTQSYCSKVGDYKFISHFLSHIDNITHLFSIITPKHLSPTITEQNHLLDNENQIIH